MPIPAYFSAPLDDIRRRASETFVLSLCDPREPQTCATLLLGCVCTLDDVDVSDLRYSYGAFCDAAMAFLTGPRDIADMGVLETTMRCFCDAEKPLRDGFSASMHYLAREQITVGKKSNTDRAIFIQCVARMATLMDVTLSQVVPEGSFYKLTRRSQDAQRHRRVFPWPCVPAQVLPGGPKDAVGHMLLWFQWDPQLWLPTLSLTSTVIMLCRTQVLPHVILCKPITNHLILHLEYVQQLWRGHAHDSRFSTTLTADAVMESFVVVARYLVSLKGCIDKPGLLILVRFGRAAPALLDVCDRAYAFLPELIPHLNLETENARTDLAETQNSYRDFAAMMFSQQSPALQRNIARLHPDVAARVRALERQLHDIYFAVFIFLHALSNDQQCAAPGCFLTYTDYGRKFRQCTGCRLVPYCSAECQRRAWAHPRAPHRAACKTMQELADKARLGSSAREADLARFVAMKRNGGGLMERRLLTVVKHSAALHGEKFDFFNAAGKRRPEQPSDFGPNRFHVKGQPVGLGLKAE